MKFFDNYKVDGSWMGNLLKIYLFDEYLVRIYEILEYMLVIKVVMVGKIYGVFFFLCL